VSPRHQMTGSASAGLLSDGTRLISGNLAPAAEDLLTAAQRILERDGYAALTYRRIAEEAGRNQALISYYFGDRAGLVTLLVHWLNRDRLLEMEQAIDAAPSNPEAVIDALLDAQIDMAHDVVGSALWLELAAHVAGDTRIRPRVALVYASYRQLASHAYPEMGPLTDLLIALVDGMALQYALGGHEFGGDGAYAVLRRLSLEWVREHVGASLHQDPPPSTAGSSVSSQKHPDTSRERMHEDAPDNPADALSPSARKVLQSAYRVLKTGGPESLTMGSAAEGSGQSTTNVSYHFGSKTELRNELARLAEFEQWSTWKGWVRQSTTADDGTGRSLVDEPRLLRNLGHMRAFHNLLPLALRNPNLLEEYRGTFASIRALIAGPQIGSGNGSGRRSEEMAVLTVALAYGLAVQLLLDRRGGFATRSFDTWSWMLQRFLSSGE